LVNLIISYFLIISYKYWGGININFSKYFFLRTNRLVNFPFVPFSQCLAKIEDNFILSANDFVSERIIPKNFQNILNYKSPQITIEEIQNFDMYYKKYDSFYKSFKKSKSIKKVTKRHDIESILERKIGEDFEKISFFLENRGSKLTDFEFVYIFKLLTEKKELISMFKEKKSELLSNSSSLVSHLFIRNVENLEKILKIYFNPSFEYKDNALIHKFINILTGAIKVYESNPEIESSKSSSQVLSSFLLLSSTKELEPNLIEKLMNISKYIMKNLDFLGVPETISFMKSLIQNRLMKSDFQMQKFNDFFSEYIESLDITQSTEILYYFTKANYLNNNFIHNFYNSFLDSKNESFENLNNQTLSKLVWSFSQYELNNERVDKLWSLIENIILNRIKTAEIAFIKIVLVAFDKAQRGKNLNNNFLKIKS
jgi:hypothetical protein